MRGKRMILATSSGTTNAYSGSRGTHHLMGLMVVAVLLADAADAA